MTGVCTDFVGRVHARHAEIDREERSCVGCGRDGFIACPDCPHEVISAALGWDREAVFVDDGLGDAFEEEAEQYDRRRD